MWAYGLTFLGVLFVSDWCETDNQAALNHIEIVWWMLSVTELEETSVSIDPSG